MSFFSERYEQMTPGSRRLFERARRVAPGGVHHNLRYFAPYPLFVERAEGAYVWDVDGNRYVDLWMGHYAHILGHRPQPVMERFLAQAAGGAHWGIVHPLQVELAETLVRLLPAAEEVRFCVTGTEATMYALRLARAFTGRKVILKARGGWHGGNSELARAVHPPLDLPESAGLPPALEEYVDTFRYNDFEESRRAIERHGADLAAVIVEPLQNAFVPPEPGYLSWLRELTERVGALLILDEVITGFRLGLTGAQGLYGVRPDLFTLGKVVGGGMPVAVIAGRREILERASPLSGLPRGEAVLAGGGTFSAMPAAMAAGLAMVGYLEEHAPALYEELATRGERLRRGLAQAFAAAGLPARVFGVGSLFSVAFPASSDMELKNNEDVESKTDLYRRDHQFRLGMLAHGVYLVNGGGALSTAHGEEEIERVVEAAAAVAEEMVRHGGEAGRS
ncbi:MAG: aminotransferase class III-fold pyridoxal phosphate-dependent enzyme [Clostridia bacterium]|nr:aminotransferase class III-fold pyridoxal phosphate-dependent enzyme [Clostridia bacterium]